MLEHPKVSNTYVLLIYYVKLSDNFENDTMDNQQGTIHCNVIH